MAVCRCVVSCWRFSVTLGEPAASPIVCPWPWCIGARLCMLGSAKLVWPLPPYIVPSSENSAWFWLIARSWPLHNAQPLGGKLNETILISPMNGSAISVSLVRRSRLRGGACGTADESTTGNLDGRRPGRGGSVEALHEVHGGGCVGRRAEIARKLDCAAKPLADSEVGCRRIGA